MTLATSFKKNETIIYIFATILFCSAIIWVIVDAKTIMNIMNNQQYDEHSELYSHSNKLLQNKRETNKTAEITTNKFSEFPLEPFTDMETKNLNISLLKAHTYDLPMMKIRQLEATDTDRRVTVRTYEHSITYNKTSWSHSHEDEWTSTDKTRKKRSIPIHLLHDIDRRPFENNNLDIIYECYDNFDDVSDDDDF